MAKFPWPKNPERGASTRAGHDRGLGRPATGPDMNSGAGQPKRKPDMPVTVVTEPLDKPGSDRGV